MNPRKIRVRIIKFLSKAWRPVSKKAIVHTKINGYSLLVLANEDVGRRIHYARSFESSETKFLEKFLSDDSICIDIGANVGYFTMLMAKHAPHGKVYAFEPIPLNALMIRTSAELNEFKNVEIIESTVGAANGDATLSQSIDSAYSSLRDTARKPIERTLHVSMITLDSFIFKKSIERVDVLKIDVEGAEGLVLSGSRQLLSRPECRPRVVLMELCDKNLIQQNTSSALLIKIMQDFNYMPYFATTTGGITSFQEDALNTYNNVLFITAETAYNV